MRSSGALSSPIPRSKIRLLRSDGVPTYHLSVVVDDIDMRMTHVVRGADHLSNTPKQMMLYEALGKPQPVFAHLPLILGPDKTRLSKRHGATSVIAYKEEGIVPEAFVISWRCWGGRLRIQLKKSCTTAS